MGFEDKRARVLSHVIWKMGFDFPITESDFSPQHRKEITKLVPLLEKYDSASAKLGAKVMEVRQYRGGFYRIWDIARGRKRWRKLEREHEIFSREASELWADYMAKVEELANSIKEYVLAGARIRVDFGRLLRALKEKGVILKTIECPNCSGIVKISEVPKKEEVLQCRYCGKSILAINLFEKFKEILGL